MNFRVAALTGTECQHSRGYLGRGAGGVKGADYAFVRIDMTGKWEPNVWGRRYGGQQRVDAGIERPSMAGNRKKGRPGPIRGYIVEVVGQDGILHHLGPFERRSQAEQWIALHSGRAVAQQQSADSRISRLSIV